MSKLKKHNGGNFFVIYIIILSFVSLNTCNGGNYTIERKNTDKANLLRYNNVIDTYFSQHFLNL